MHYENVNDPKAFELSWTWGEIVEKFLAEKLPDLKEKYRKQYASYLRHSAFDLIKNKRMHELSIKDLERCRDDMKAVAAKSAVRRAVQQGKEMLSWAWLNHAGDSGLHDVEYKWWDRWTMKYKSNKRERSPRIEELARTLAIAESYRTLSEQEQRDLFRNIGCALGGGLDGAADRPARADET
jgi:isoleucyl-tRNA synthetase